MLSPVLLSEETNNFLWNFYTTIIVTSTLRRSRQIQNE